MSALPLDPLALLQKSFGDGLRVIAGTREACGSKLLELAGFVRDAFSGDGKLLIFGNGGSAADAQHLAAEFINRFRLERRPLPALALTTDTSVLTAVANDYAFDEVFSKQVQALGRPGDVALGITTSGSSPNVVRALEAARMNGLRTAALTGARGGEVTRFADLCLSVPSADTPRVQEAHILIEHILCDLVEQMLFARS